MQRQEIVDLAGARISAILSPGGPGETFEGHRRQRSAGKPIPFVRNSICFARRRRAHGREFFWAGDWVATGWPATMEGRRPQRLFGCGSTEQRSQRTGAFFCNPIWLPPD